MTSRTDSELGRRRSQFCQLISAYSEDQWAAGWLSGIEQQIREQPDNELWLALAAVCGGWPVGYEGEEGWDPLTADEWVRVREIIWEARLDG